MQDAPARLGTAELRRVVADADVAEQRQLEPASQTVATDRGDHRLGRLQTVVEALARPRSPGLTLAKLQQIVPGRKCSPATADDHAAHVGIAISLAQRVTDRLIHLIGHRVELLGPQQRDRGDMSVDGVSDLVHIEVLCLGANQRTAPAVFSSSPTEPFSPISDRISSVC